MRQQGSEASRDEPTTDTRLRALVEASRLFAASGLDFAGVLDTVARHVAGSIGDVCTIRLLSEDRSHLDLAGIHHDDPSALTLLRELSQNHMEVGETPIGRVAVTGEPLLIPVVSLPEFRASVSPRFWPYLDRFGVHSMIAVPLRDRATAIGVLTVSRTSPGRPYGVEDQTFLQALADRAAMVIASARMHDTLRHSEARKAGILEAALDCIITIDHKGKILDFNPAAERTFGHRRADVIGQELASLLIPEPLRAAHRRGLAHYLESGEGPVLARRIELPALRADGSEFPAEIAITVIRTNGPPIFTAFLRDLTEQKRAEEERARLLKDLEQAVRARDAFISIASHELRTPLSALQLQLDLLKRGASQEPAGAPENVAAKVDIIRRQVGRLNKLVDNLLEVSRITAGRVKLELEPGDLAALVREIAGRFDEELRRARCPTIIRGDVTLLGRWDRMRIEQIVVNLVSNAIKYAPGQTIEIAVEGDARHGRIVVRDHGPGIAREDQARIFEPFERLVAGRGAGGFGLGLWIVRQLVEAFGGTIRVSSEPGAGATFTVELPRGLGEVVEEGAAPGVASPERKRGEHVLVVEDDHDVREAVGDALRAEGYGVTCTTNGREALDYLHGAGPPRLILLDLRMPVMDGWEFMDAVGKDQSLAAIPVVLLSADRDLGRRARELHAAAYIEKPVDLDMLLSTVQRHCEATHVSAK